MNKLEKIRFVPLTTLSWSASVKRIINICIEIAVVIATIGMGIYYLAIADPLNRFMSCVGTAVAFIAPWVIELIRGKRFTFLQHLLYDFYMFTSMFLGMVLFLHHSFPPYDEIMHVIFGYFACLAIFYGFMHTKALVKGKVFSAVAIFFFVSMGTAALWECMEFVMDVMFGENSLGFPSAGVIEFIEQNNLTGIEANLYSLRYTSVMDTATDMVLHLGGSVVFITQYFLHEKWGKDLILKSLVNEWKMDEMNSAIDSNNHEENNGVISSIPIVDENINPDDNSSLGDLHSAINGLGALQENSSN